ncbi:hypothetical protein QVD17_01184 [Tagetes erecta]|uniref:Uncharacterized protein n=1 Tax=Tagetes erecta TaxID=13708 RepID=A0AAD8P843_TARER|nr:hypothetical protein QVD17_01184 [Tagetes erecta]
MHHCVKYRGKNCNIAIRCEMRKTLAKAFTRFMVHSSLRLNQIASLCLISFRSKVFILSIVVNTRSRA